MLSKKPSHLILKGNESQRGLLRPILPPCLETLYSSEFPAEDQDDISSTDSQELGWNPDEDAEEELSPDQIKKIKSATSSVDFNNLALFTNEFHNDKDDEFTEDLILQFKAATSKVNFDISLAYLDTEAYRKLSETFTSDFDLTPEQIENIRSATRSCNIQLTDEMFSF